MFKRLIQSKINAALARSPVLLLTGARQTGKTTLAKEITQEKVSCLKLLTINEFLPIHNEFLKNDRDYFAELYDLEDESKLFHYKVHNYDEIGNTIDSNRNSYNYNAQ